MRDKWASLRTGGCGQKFSRAQARTFFSSPLTQPPQFQNRVYAPALLIILAHIHFVCFRELITITITCKVLSHAFKTVSIILSTYMHEGEIF